MEDSIPVLKLADLCKLYTNRLKQLGVDLTNRVNSTHLKDRLLANVPGLCSNKSKRDVYPAFEEDIGVALEKACKEDDDDEAIVLAHAARIVRRDMFLTESSFTGSFDEECQQNSIPGSLLALVRMILNGPNIISQSDRVSQQAALTISQLIQFNSYVRRRDGSDGKHHNKNRETPLPVFVGLRLHAKTRKKSIVNELFHLGLSMSYERVISIETNITNQVTELYKRDNVVCPPILQKGIFITGAVDNIDVNPTSSTAQSSFHGTGISLFQHRDISSSNVNERVIHIGCDNETTVKQVSLLPDFYTNVSPAKLKDKNPSLPEGKGTFSDSFPSEISNAMNAEKEMVRSCCKSSI